MLEPNPHAGEEAARLLGGMVSAVLNGMADAYQELAAKERLTRLLLGRPCIASFDPEDGSQSFKAVAMKVGDAADLDRVEPHIIDLWHAFLSFAEAADIATEEHNRRHPRIDPRQN